MLNSAITHLQIFGIGFSFGIAGPCFIFCVPVLITYLLGRRQRLLKTLGGVLVFCVGRLAAYLVLGALAGLSGSIIRRFVGPGSGAYAINFIAGAISIALGVSILFGKGRAGGSCTEGAAEGAAEKACDSGGLLALGFIMGISPCGPLTTLLAEIALISKSALEGMSYAFSFGLGTLLAGLITVGAVMGIAGGVVGRFVRSKTAAGTFSVLCAALLVLLGLYLMLNSTVLKI
jgi:sulfite exporter TauE/SafE